MKSTLRFFLLLSFTLPAAAQRYTVFPQFASGGGWSTTIFSASQGLSAITGISAAFFDSSGAPLAVTSNLGTGSVFNFNLNAGATQVICVTPGGTLVVGYVVLKYATLQAAVTASEVFRYEQAAAVTAEVGVAQQIPDNNYSFPVEMNSSAGITTAVAFVNASLESPAVAQTLVASLINSDGTLQKTVTVPLAAGEHIPLYLDDARLFPGLDSFTGSLTVSSPMGVGVLTLRQDKQAFGAISTDAGPVIAPFAVTGPTVSETEPNNSAAAAQSLAGTSLVTGAIGSLGDVDWFTFTGKQGDIVTLICDTQNANSYLDSIVSLLKSDGTTELAANDQSGLYNSNDSFLQAVLPADGTYLISVTDYYGSGSYNYTYRLHVRVTSEPK